jgi:leucyl-tRNA synthetase
VLKEAVEALVAMLSPFSPHMADDLWQKLGHPGFLVNGPWPAFDPTIAKEDEITLAVQVNGKVRGQVTVAADAGPETVLEVAKTHEKVRPYLDGKQLVKEMVVPGKIVTFVVR